MDGISLITIQYGMMMILTAKNPTRLFLFCYVTTTTDGVLSLLLIYYSLKVRQIVNRGTHMREKTCFFTCNPHRP